MASVITRQGTQLFISKILNDTRQRGLGVKSITVASDVWQTLGGSTDFVDVPVSEDPSHGEGDIHFAIEDIYLGE